MKQRTLKTLKQVSTLAFQLVKIQKAHKLIG
jgi:hypothetical protein